MIIELNHTHKMVGKVKLWHALVCCESPFHIGDRNRLVTKYNILNGIGVKNCDRCSTIENNKTEKMRECLRNRVWSEESRKKISIAGMGKIISKEQREKSSLAQKGKPRFDLRGEKSASWKPWLTPEERVQRRLCPEFINWSQKVKERDNYTCQVTGIRGGLLRSHHLYSYCKYPDKRHDVNNGITLCEIIHKIFHKIYGTAHNTPEQFEEFKLYITEVLFGE